MLLALPLPATNYVFGLILLAYAIALIERDGRLMAIAWVAGLVEIGVIAPDIGSTATIRRVGGEPDSARSIDDRDL